MTIYLYLFNGHLEPFLGGSKSDGFLLEVIDHSTGLYDRFVLLWDACVGMLGLWVVPGYDGLMLFGRVMCS